MTPPRLFSFNVLQGKPIIEGFLYPGIFDVAEIQRLPLSNEDGFNEIDTGSCLTIADWTFSCLPMR